MNMKFCDQCAIPSMCVQKRKCVKGNQSKEEAAVERWIETARNVDETFGRIEAAFMANPENEVRSAIWGMFAEYTRTLAAILSDDAEDARVWLEWFAWECDFGRKPKEMLFSDGETLLVVGASDLLAAIQTDENGRRVWPSPLNETSDGAAGFGPNSP